jgi:hypothetical protein
MNNATFTQDALVRLDDPQLAVLFPDQQKRFFVSPQQHAESTLGPSLVPSVVPSGSQQLPQHEWVVRLPPPPVPRERITALQRWVGLVESVGNTTFIARISDETNTTNPIEEVELPLEEVSASDRELAVPGGTFYWSIGYRDSADGQRERISTLRFARQPKISLSEQNRIIRQADELTALLERE